jgi:DNA-binding CsgD family transcriptional regulator
MLRVVAEAAAADGETPFERPLIERLSRLVPADRAGYFEYRAPDYRELYRVRVGPLFPWFEYAAAVQPPTAWPLHDGHHSAATEALKWSDFVGPRQRLRHPWYIEVMRRTTVEHEIKLWLPSPKEAVRGFYLIREPGRPDFDERDRAVLTLLRLQLASIRERWEQRRRPPGLTAREAEIVHLLREGLTNQEIADRLVISTGTVRTHLEHIFHKLGVHTRTAVIAHLYARPTDPNNA